MAFERTDINWLKFSDDCCCNRCCFSTFSEVYRSLFEVLSDQFFFLQKLSKWKQKEDMESVYGLYMICSVESMGEKETVVMFFFSFKKHSLRLRVNEELCCCFCFWETRNVARLTHFGWKLTFSIILSLWRNHRQHSCLGILNPRWPQMALISPSDQFLGLQLPHSCHPRSPWSHVKRTAKIWYVSSRLLSQHILARELWIGAILCFWTIPLDFQDQHCHTLLHMTGNFDGSPSCFFVFVFAEQWLMIRIYFLLE